MTLIIEGLASLQALQLVLSVPSFCAYRANESLCCISLFRRGNGKLMVSASLSNYWGLYRRVVATRFSRREAGWLHRCL